MITPHLDCSHWLYTPEPDIDCAHWAFVDDRTSDIATSDRMVENTEKELTLT